MRRRVTIIGDGGWGTALATVLARNGHEVTVWGPFPDVIERIRAEGSNEAYLPGVPLSSEIEWSHEVDHACHGADAVVLAIPTRYFSGVLESFRRHIPAAAPIISATKGLDRASLRVMTHVAEEILGIRGVSALSGPSHAEEVARKIPTAVVAASETQGPAEWFQELFTDSCLRVYTARDVVGVQLGGALKNVIALATGMSDGLGYGDNTRAALMTRGVVEMSRLGAALGASPETFHGLSGMGDLIVTSTSRHSRNRAVGERIGRGEPVEHIMADMRQAVEGIWNCGQAIDLARRHGVEMPISEQVHEVLNAGKAPKEALEDLFKRPPEPERGNGRRQADSPRPRPDAP